MIINLLLLMFNFLFSLVAFIAFSIQSSALGMVCGRHAHECKVLLPIYEAAIPVVLELKKQGSFDVVEYYFALI